MTTQTTKAEFNGSRLAQQLAASIRLAQTGGLQKAIAAKLKRQEKNARKLAWRTAR